MLSIALLSTKVLNSGQVCLAMISSTSNLKGTGGYLDAGNDFICQLLCILEVLDPRINVNSQARGHIELCILPVSCKGTPAASECAKGNPTT